MKKAVLIAIAALALMLAGAMPGSAADLDGGDRGSHSDGRDRGGPGIHAPSGGDRHDAGPGVRDGGFRDHGGGFRDHDRGFRGGGGSVWIGPGWDPFWYPWWWGGYYPYSPYYPYPYPAQPPVVIQQETPPMYQEPTAEPNQPVYWYHCSDPEGYYPYVKQCPGGWQKVVPTPPPGEEGK